MHCIHQKMSSKHSLWLGWVVGNEDIAADKIDKNTCSYGSHMLVEEGRKKLKIEGMPDSIKC